MAAVHKITIFLIALQTSFYLINGAPSYGSTSTNSIIHQTVEMPEGCRDKTFCFHQGNHYPNDRIQEMLKTNKLGFTIISPERPGNETNQREGEIGDGPRCHSSTKTMPIYYIRDKNNDVRVVLQSETYFKQVISVVECGSLRGIGKTDHKFCENLNFHYKFIVLTKNFDDIELVENAGGLPVSCVIRKSRGY